MSIEKRSKKEVKFIEYYFKVIIKFFLDKNRATIFF